VATWADTDPTNRPRSLLPVGCREHRREAEVLFGEIAVGLQAPIQQPQQRLLSQRDVFASRQRGGLGASARVHPERGRDGAAGVRADLIAQPDETSLAGVSVVPIGRSQQRRGLADVGEPARCRTTAPAGRAPPTAVSRRN
jgi:hypothetical protein